jgi:CDP-glucose 4,6-dehydratase
MESLVNLNLFKGIYQNKRVLITGHTGFKGSWLAAWLKMMGAEVTGYSLKPETKPNHYDALDLDIQSIIGDITDQKQLKVVMQTVKPEIVFHLAAQSLVRRSYREPIYTYQTNLMGALNLYEASLHCNSIKAIISVTSDKVYENMELHQSYIESDQLGGYDMYSSSKACVELMTNSFRRSFLKKGDGCAKHIVTARAGNVIGGGDWAEDRLVPDVMRAIQKGDKVVIRNPNAVRPWQHVLEPLSGYLLLGQLLLKQSLLKEDSWNFGPMSDEFITVEDVLNKIKVIMPELDYVIEEHDALHEAGILSVDSERARNILEWMAVWKTDTTVKKTTEWYKHYFKTGELLTFENIKQYVGDAMRKQIIWAKQ